MKLSIFKNTYAAAGDAGEVISLSKLMEIKQNEDIKQTDKFNLPVLQVHACPKFLVKKDALSFKIYNFWEGALFIDVDDPKKEIINEDGQKEYVVCDWWQEVLIYDRLLKFAYALSKYPWFVGIGLSSSGKGYHILGFKKAKWQTEDEYIASYIYAYNDVYNELYNVFSEFDKTEVLRMLDDHNIYPYQKFIIGNKKFYMSSKFDEDFSNNIIKNFNSDEEYLSYAKEKCSRVIVNKVMNKFEKIKNTRSGDPIKYNIDDAEIKAKYSVSNNYSIIKNNSVQYFNNKYRFMLVKTLKCFYNKSDAYSIAIQIYDQYYQEGHDKKAAHDHIRGLIDDESPFMPQDWFINILIKCGVIKKRPIYDKYYDMDELGISYLSELMPNILEDLGNITILEAPVSSGKTTAMRMVKMPLWCAAPYNSIIKNNFNESLTPEFQCLYDDYKFDQSLFTNERNKVASSYNKLTNVDKCIFIQNKIEYLFIDESHIIFEDCKFRSDVIYKLIRKIVELARNGVKVILMSGTPLKEKELFSMYKDLDVKYIKINRKHKYNKKMTIKYYDGENEEGKSNGFVREDFIVDEINNFILNGYKILIPFNRGDAKIEKLMSRLEAKYNNVYTCNDDFNIYKRQYRNFDINKKISYEGAMDASIMFATKYLSVGVSIYNREKCVILFYGEDFSAYQIEQYSCRFRNIDVECVWYINRSVIDLKTECDFSLVKYPSEEEIKDIIKGIEQDLKYRKWESWDVIVKKVLENYRGIIKEDVFELGKFYYDELSLNLDWYCNSLDNYYSYFKNNVKELNKYGFDIESIDVTKKCKVNYRDELNLNIIKKYERKIELIEKWIDYINADYFDRGIIEGDFYGENIYMEPFISMHKFAMFAWYNFISIDNIKQMLRSIYMPVNTEEYNRLISKIETAKKSIEKGDKRYVNNAKKKLKEAMNELKDIDYNIHLNLLTKYKQLIFLFSHYKLNNISRLMRYVIDYGNNINEMLRAEGDIHKMKYDDIISNVALEYNKMYNAPDVIDYDKYINIIKKAIKNIYDITYDVGIVEGVLTHFNKTKYSQLNDNWFDLDYSRNKSNFGLSKDTIFALN